MHVAALMVMAERVVLPANAFAPMLVTPAAPTKLRVVSEVHPEKALAPMLVSDVAVARFTVVSDAQPSKAFAAIAVTEAPRNIAVAFPAQQLVAESAQAGFVLRTAHTDAIPPFAQGGREATYAMATSVSVIAPA